MSIRKRPGGATISELVKYLPMLGVGIGSAVIMVLWAVWTIWTVLLGYGIALTWAYVSSKGPHGFAYGGLAVFGVAVAYGAYLGSLNWTISMALVAGAFTAFAFVRNPWQVSTDEIEMWKRELRPPKTRTDYLRLILTVSLAGSALFVLLVV